MYVFRARLLRKPCYSLRVLKQFQTNFVLHFFTLSNMSRKLFMYGTLELHSVTVGVRGL